MSDIYEEHGPDCTCGCHDHDHEHRHDHDHATHDAFETDAASISLEAHTHEQAATVSLDIHPKTGNAIAFSSLVDSMKTIADEAETAGGVVGHIKAYARDGVSFAHASVTAPDLPPVCEGNVQASFGADATIQLVSIVLLVDLDDLAAICRKAIA
ncbi:MAG: hypothetical protein IJ087_15425 [Eggerthellaceae bacterium]|nr:hypothetical protein [Eggerthellaceae bacterium]